MRFARFLAVGASAVVCVGACGSPSEKPGRADAADEIADAGGPDATPEAAAALWELPRAGVATSEFYALPFPNDLRRKEDGRIDLTGHVTPNPLLEDYFATFQEELTGFGTNSAIFFRFSGRIDHRMLPSPSESVMPSSPIYLVDVDPDSAERGRRIPLRFRFEVYEGETIGSHWLSCLPYPGFPLRQQTTYALVVTTRLFASDGTPVTPADDLVQILVDDPTNDQDVVRAREVYAPLLTWLDEKGGDERSNVASATVFTTQDATSLMGRIRDVIWREVPEPRARDVRYLGTYNGYVLYEGKYDGPNFQQGETPYLVQGGKIEVDPTTGDPIVQRMEPIRFAVSFPVGEMPEGGWPIVLYAHGTGGDYLSFYFDGTAERMAWQGLAVISIDQVLHGPRNPNGGSVELAFFNFQNPVAARDNVRQGALDDFQLVRLARDLTIAPRHPGARIYRTDPDRLYFMGHSQGGLTGPPFLAYEPLIQGAVLSGAGGLIYYSLILKTEPVDITAIIGTFVRDVPLDEFNPVLALVQMFIEPADPTNYGPLLVAEPPEGIEPKDIFQSEGLIDHYTPPTNIEALGVSIQASPVAPILVDVPGFALRGLDVLDAPVESNLNGRTAVFLQYEAPPDSDGHYVVFRVPAAQKQHAEFLGTLARDGRATLVVP